MKLFISASLFITVISGQGFSSSIGNCISADDQVTLSVDNEEFKSSAFNTDDKCKDICRTDAQCLGYSFDGTDKSCKIFKVLVKGNEIAEFECNVKKLKDENPSVSELYVMESWTSDQTMMYFEKYSE